MSLMFVYYYCRVAAVRRCSCFVRCYGQLSSIGFHHKVERLLGGTFALYSLICRHAKAGLLPNRQASDEDVSTCKLEHPPEAKSTSLVKKVLEKHKGLHTALLILVLLGTCMVVGDGLLTPAISVSTAVSGLESLMSKEHPPYATARKLH